MKTRRSTRLSKKLEENPETLEVNLNTINTPGEVRCLEWIQSQKKNFLKSRKINDRKSSSKFEKTPAPAADSLAALKQFNPAEIRENILFICEWKECLKELQSSEDLYKHVSDHITEVEPIRRKYYCKWDLCHFDTECNKEISRHIHYHAYHTVLKTVGESISQLIKFPPCTYDSTKRNLLPILKEDFLCQWNDCKDSFQSVHDFHVHVRTHCNFEYEFITPPKRQHAIRCKWDSCDKQFLGIYRLLEHMRTHTKLRTVGCYQCGALFRANTTFYNHCKRQEPIREFQCVQCLKYFASERLLRLHVISHVNSYQCTQCKITCPSPYALTRHIRYRHIEERPFQCPHCEQRTVTKHDLQSHMHVHKKKVYSCAEIGCKFTTRNLYELKQHDLQVHGESSPIYECHFCDEQYKKGKLLSVHLRTEHNLSFLPGHRRFTYRMDEDGIYRLQTMRIESLDVTKRTSNNTKDAADYGGGGAGDDSDECNSYDIQSTNKSHENSLNYEQNENCEGYSIQINDISRSGRIKRPFKVIATHDSVVDELEIPMKRQRRKQQTTTINNQVSKAVSKKKVTKKAKRLSAKKVYKRSQIETRLKKNLRKNASENVVISYKEFNKVVELKRIPRDELI